MTAPATTAVLLADGGPAAGLGHLSRSSALAWSLRCHGLDTVCLSPGLEDVTHRFGVSWRPFSPRDGDAPNHAAVVGVDSYHLDPATVRETIASQLLVAFDDGGGGMPAADLVIDAGDDPAATSDGRLCGPAFACLGPPFWGLPERQVPREGTSVLVTVGSGEAHDVDSQVARAILARAPEATVRLITPGETAANEAGVEALPPAESLDRELLAADVVVVSAGQRMLEALATGAACVALVTADNQRRQAERLAAAGALEIAATPDASAELASRLMADASARARMVKRGRAAVDGYGALRVGREVVERVRAQPSRGSRPATGATSSTT